MSWTEREGFIIDKGRGITIDGEGITTDRARGARVTSGLRIYAGQQTMIKV